MKKQMLLPFIILAGVPFIMVLGNSMLIPVFPQMERAMNLNRFQVGLIVTLFSLPAGIIIPFAGALSDHLGRKTIMVPALFVYGLGGLISGIAAIILTNPYHVILLGRVVQGIGAGGTYQLAMALTGDIFTSQERTKVLGYLEAANGFGKVLSPILGAALALISWYTPFFAYSLLAIPIAIAVCFIVEENKDQLQPQPIAKYWQSLCQVFANKAAPLLACYAVGAIGLFLLFGLLSFLSDELEFVYKVAGFAKGGVLAIPFGAMAITSFTGGLVLQAHQQWLKYAIISGLAFTTISLVTLAACKQPILIVGLATFAAIGIGMLLPPLNTFITSATDSSERGLITCFYGTVRFLGVAMGPPLFAIVAATSRLYMFAGAAVISGLGILIATLWIDSAKLLDPIKN